MSPAGQGNDLRASAKERCWRRAPSPRVGRARARPTPCLKTALQQTVPGLRPQAAVQRRPFNGGRTHARSHLRKCALGNRRGVECRASAVSGEEGGANRGIQAPPRTGLGEGLVGFGTAGGREGTNRDSRWCLLFSGACSARVAWRLATGEGDVVGATGALHTYMNGRRRARRTSEEEGVRSRAPRHRARALRAEGRRAPREEAQGHWSSVWHLARPAHGSSAHTRPPRLSPANSVARLYSRSYARGPLLRPTTARRTGRIVRRSPARAMSGSSDKKKKSVMFVCLGNICRSPTAEAVFRNLVEKQGTCRALRTSSQANTRLNHLINAYPSFSQVAGLAANLAVQGRQTCTKLTLVELVVAIRTGTCLAAGAITRSVVLSCCCQLFAGVSRLLLFRSRCSRTNSLSHVQGEDADRRMQATATKRGIRLTSKSRPLTPEDVEKFDLLVRSRSPCSCCFAAAALWAHPRATGSALVLELLMPRCND
eukprot:scaffold4470_cov255-Prasinococcus_capsulatus_cf.AAC.26